MSKKHYTQLSEKEKMRREAKSMRFIARRLYPCLSTISQETQLIAGSKASAFESTAK